MEKNIKYDTPVKCVTYRLIKHLKLKTNHQVEVLTLKAPPIICSRRQFQILLFFFKNNK